MPSPSLSSPTILRADDDYAICTVLSHALADAGLAVQVTDDPQQLLTWVQEGIGDAVLTDVLMPKGNGLEFLPRLRSAAPAMPIIVMSANNTLMTAVKAAELGATEYFPKPFDLDVLIEALKKLTASPARSAAKKESTTKKVQEPENTLIGRSPAMQNVYKSIARLVNVDLSVMLHGESGTGKEMIARTLHGLSNRKHKPFVAVNMAAIPRDLIESELFGHEKGAFTGATSRKAGRFEQAEGGVLFLDEIGDMPLEAQTRLLRILQEKEYTPVGSTSVKRTDVRIVCATHRNMQAMVDAGSFRQDLYFRLNVVPLHIPPLRERGEDMEALAEFFLQKAVQKGLPAKRLDKKAVKALQAYHWPGNVRELENILYRFAALQAEEIISAEAIAKELQGMAENRQTSEKLCSLDAMVEKHLLHYFAEHGQDLPPAGVYDRIVRLVEKPLLSVTMKKIDGNQLRAAELLGINRNTLRKKLREHGML